jgi:dihydrofolate synthase/folylpolyglutamate synthase
MNYSQAVAHLYALGHELARTPPPKFDLAHMRVLIVALGDPQQRFKSVLIAGTNGKGSTAATLASILHAAGHRTGLYTSPHLVRINERIRVNGAAISDAEFASTYNKVDETAKRLVERGELPWHPSFFETMTAIAFEYFAGAGVEIAVLEVGMGGRLDATNLVEPLVSVITDISLDHQKYLGNTIAEIAGEKAGIIRQNGVAVILPQHPQANDVLGRAILEKDARAVSATAYMPPVTPEADAKTAAGESSYTVTALGEEVRIQPALRGRHQLRNTALAIATAVELDSLGVGVPGKAIARGVRETRWPGRLQVVSGAPEFLFDVAHNPDGAWALRAALSHMYPERRLVVLFGAMRDKAVAEMASILFPLASVVVATHAENPRAASPEEIAQAAARTGAEMVLESRIPEALEKARALAGSDGVVVVTGSIYLVGEAMRLMGIVS